MGIYLLLSHEPHAAMTQHSGSYKDNKADLHTTAHARVSSAYDVDY